MNIAFRNGVSGMQSAQRALDITANNVANVGTVAFKGSRPSFSELLYTKIDRRDTDKMMTGHGAKVASVDMLHTQGNFQPTGNPLDFTVVGQGFFGVLADDGTMQYTRSGAFKLSPEGKKTMLVTSDGRHVVDAKGKPIEITMKDGEPQTEELKDELGLFIFPNTQGLEPQGTATFMPTEASGQPTERTKLKDKCETELVQFSLEDSNVDLATEMSGVIVSQRAFQLNARVVQTADQIEQIVSSLRG